MTEKNQEIEQLATEMTKATDEVKAIAEELTGKSEKGEKNLASVKEKADEALIAFNETKARLDEIDQKLARRGGEGDDSQKSLGQQFFETDQFKAFANDPRGMKSARLNVKATLTSLTTDAAGSAGALVTPSRQPGIVTPPQQNLRLRELIMTGKTDSNAIEFVRETGFVNNADPQAGEGAVKPESDLQFDDVTLPVRTLAHHVSASKQILHDAPMLESYINGRLMYGLKLKEDQQLLNGDGTGNNLTGILPQATTFADPLNLATYTIIDQIRLAMLQAVLAEYPASATVLNPMGWARIELLKDGEGRNIIGQPQGNAPATLWRAPVVETKAMAADGFLTGSFDLAAQLFDREQIGIAVSDEHADNFTTNKVTILCEERLALAVYRPEAFIKGTLTAKTA